ncbi:MAG: lysophospholipid acyltransferase family protein [bacterium]|nr:lysophospholipid acyltransferase family protein [bacterium]
MSRTPEEGTRAVYDEWGCDPAAPLSVRMAGAGVAAWLKFVYATSRGECLQPDRHREILGEPSGSYIGVFWHHQIALPSFFYPGVPRACLASRSRDGELLAQIVAGLGSRCVRGSSAGMDGRQKGGAVSLREMARAAKAGFHLAVTPDGPKGPAEKLKPGVVFLAAMTGLPVVPLGFAASSCFRLNTWDRTIIPFPFTRLILSYGEPLEITEVKEDGSLEEYRAEVERRLLAVNEEARAALGNRP